MQKTRPCSNMAPFKIIKNGLGSIYARPSQSKGFLGRWQRSTGDKARWRGATSSCPEREARMPKLRGLPRESVLSEGQELAGDGDYRPKQNFSRLF